MNGLLVDYCEENDISFTRCRPYKKNDQAHIEQKNWTAVRKLIGYDRYASEEALRLLEEVYKDWRLLVNYFQPVRKLTGKERVDGKVRKLYDQAKTPYQRVLASPAVEEEAKERLREIYLTLNPVKLRRQMEENLHALWKVHEYQLSEAKFKPSVTRTFQTFMSGLIATRDRTNQQRTTTKFPFPGLHYLTPRRY